jgi:hypothetical protein
MDHVGVRTWSIPHTLARWTSRDRVTSKSVSLAESMVSSCHEIPEKKRALTVKPHVPLGRINNGRKERGLEALERDGVNRPPAHVASLEGGAELVYELYWKGASRDVPVSPFTSRER